jgi:septum formation protein
LTFWHVRALRGRSKALCAFALCSATHAFFAQVAGIDEKAIRHESPEELVMALARAKADAIRARVALHKPAVQPRPALLITSDQVVLHRGVVREKPDSPAQAREFIRSYGGTSARTVGAVLVTNLASGFSVGALDVAEVFFHPFSEEVIEQLVAQGECLHCAGGLMVEHPLVRPFVRDIQGDLDSVMGLGSVVTTRLLLQAAEQT